MELVGFYSKKMYKHVLNTQDKVDNFSQYRNGVLQI